MWMSSALVALAAVAASHEMRQAELIDYAWMGACHVVLCFVHLVRFRKHRILYTRAHVAHNHEYRECNDTCHADHFTRHLRTPWAWLWVLLLAYGVSMVPSEGRVHCRDAWPALLLASALEANTVLLRCLALVCFACAGVPSSLAGVVRCLCMCVALHAQTLLSRFGRAAAHMAVGLLYIILSSEGRIGLPATGLACLVADITGCRPGLMMVLVVVCLSFQ
jgi:hypothetical protein